MNNVMNLGKKKVCRIDPDKLVVEIIQKGIYITVIRFDPETQTLIVENSELSKGI